VGPRSRNRCSLCRRRALAWGRPPCTCSPRPPCIRQGRPGPQPSTVRSAAGPAAASQLCTPSTRLQFLARAFAGPAGLCTCTSGSCSSPPRTCTPAVPHTTAGPAAPRGWSAYRRPLRRCRTTQPQRTRPPCKCSSLLLPKRRRPDSRSTHRRRSLARLPLPSTPPPSAAATGGRAHRARGAKGYREFDPFCFFPSFLHLFSALFFFSFNFGGNPVHLMERTGCAGWAVAPRTLQRGEGAPSGKVPRPHIGNPRSPQRPSLRDNTLRRHEKECEQISKRVSEQISERVSEQISKRVSKRISKRVSARISKRVSERPRTWDVTSSVVGPGPEGLGRRCCAAHGSVRGSRGRRGRRGRRGSRGRRGRRGRGFCAPLPGPETAVLGC
jgi:hypothetical protein